MVRVNTPPSPPALLEPPRHDLPAGRGRPFTDVTILSLVMKQRGIRVNQIARVLLCGDRAAYNYLARRRALPVIRLGALCDFLDMDPAQLVDARNVLLPLPHRKDT